MRRGGEAKVGQGLEKRHPAAADHESICAATLCRCPQRNARSAFHDSNLRIKSLASFAITVSFLDGVVFVQTLEAFGFDNGLVLSRESLPIDLRVGPANMVVIHRW